MVIFVLVKLYSLLIYVFVVLFNLGYEINECVLVEFVYYLSVFWVIVIKKLNNFVLFM